MICPKCKQDTLVNSVPLSKFVACHNCRTFYSLEEVKPVESLGGTKVYVNLEVKKGE